MKIMGLQGCPVAIQTPLLEFQKAQIGMINSARSFAPHLNYRSGRDRVPG
jgi:hypothetical protein